MKPAEKRREKREVVCASRLVVGPVVFPGRTP